MRNRDPTHQRAHLADDRPERLSDSPRPSPITVGPGVSEEVNGNCSRVPFRIGVILFLYRVLIAFTLRTAESPDEWWQSAEVAYYMVFGKGHLTWEWKAGIRSVAFPAMYALPFYVLKMLRLDSAYSILAAERLVQALIATGIDLTMLALAGKIDRAIWKDSVDDAAAAGHDKAAEDKRIVAVDIQSPDEASLGGSASKQGGWVASPFVMRTTARLAMFQWYVTYDGARAYSNVAEGLFVMLAALQANYYSFLLVAGVACMVRVTAAIALFPIFLYHVLRQVRRRGILRGLCYCFVGAVVILSVVVGAMMLVDYVFYHRWVLTPLRFVEFNLVKNVSHFYGVYPWWWYFAAGFPIMVGPHLIFLLMLPLVQWRLAASGYKAARRTRALVWRLLGLLLWTLTAHSIVPHKEVRFMFPMLPVAIVLISFVISTFVRQPQSMRFFRMGGGSNRGRGTRALLGVRVVLCLHRLFICVNVALIVLFVYVYRQGGVGVMAAVRNAPTPVFDRVDVLTHCYFTPGYSHVHKKVQELRLIDCPVELDSVTAKRKTTEDVLYRQYPSEFVYWFYNRRLPQDVPRNVSESSAFHSWLEQVKELFPEGAEVTLPDGIIVFGFVSEARGADFFEVNGYHKHRRVFHATKSFEEDEDSYVDFWIRNATTTHT